MAAVVSSLPPAPPPARPRMLFVGTALAVAAGTVLFAALLGAYLAARDAAGGTTAAWVPAEVTFREVATTVAMLTLVSSSVTVQWAVYAMARSDRRNSYLALGLTALFGLAYINSMAYVYRNMGLELARDEYSLLVYAITGTHVAVLFGAVVFVGLTAFRTLGGRYSAKDTEGITAAAVFWHFTVVVGVAIWAIVFALK